MSTVIHAEGMRDYEVTADDRLWLLRAVAAEGRPHIAVAEALVNLFALTRERGVTQPLARLVRAYAQPINPRWFESGDLFAAKLAREPQNELALRAAARRREAVHSKAVEFPPHVLRAVELALEGRHNTDVTDYAAHWVDASKKYEARSRVVPGANRFWTRAPGWTGYAATRPGGSAAGDDVPGGTVGLLLAMMVVVGAWALAARL